MFRSVGIPVRVRGTRPGNSTSNNQRPMGILGGIETRCDNTMSKKKYDLEDRLLEYSAMIVRPTEEMDASKAGNYVGGQLLRSGISPLFNHGEAEAAESPKDFIHKLGVCLKELRESKRALRLT